MEYVSSFDIVKSSIKVDKSGMNNSESNPNYKNFSLTPVFGEGLESIDQLEKSELAWSTEFKEINNDNYAYEVIYENNILKPWKLIKKK